MIVTTGSPLSPDPQHATSDTGCGRTPRRSRGTRYTGTRTRSLPRGATRAAHRLDRAGSRCGRNRHNAAATNNAQETAAIELDQHLAVDLRADNDAGLTRLWDTYSHS